MKRSPHDWNEIPQVRGQPDFNQLLAVLRLGVPGRSTLFEFFLNDRLYNRLVPEFSAAPATPENKVRVMISANERLGYDYAPLVVPNFSFSDPVITRKK